jgi:hypothetical protein
MIKSFVIDLSVCKEELTYKIILYVQEIIFKGVCSLKKKVFDKWCMIIRMSCR